MVGDIVLAPLPFTDLSDLKIRPLVVLADVGMRDWIVCQITSSTSHRFRQIEIASDDLRSGNLRVVSYARPDRIFTLNDSIFQRTLGRLTDAKTDEILSEVRELF